MKKKNKKLLFLYTVVEVCKMDKKLPKVFANKIDREFHNNEKVFVASHEEEKKNPKVASLDLRGMNVNQKIKSIFNSKNYIYKADVEIVQKGQKKVKKIIGKNGNNLITIDNEIIPIDTIEDISLL